MGVSAARGSPPKEHPKRPVLGIAGLRSEVSGEFLWGLARDRFATPKAFFSRLLIWNLCPLCFLEESGPNPTPDKLRLA